MAMYSNRIKKIPYGRTNLEKIIREGYYYVDKTRFIRMLEDDGGYIIFLRPRRYGKSLTIAMLEYYYGIQYADRFDAIFGELEIGKEPTSLHNTYLVLSLNFSAVDSDKDKVEESFNTNLLQSLVSFTRTYKDYLPEGTSDLMGKYTKSNDAFNFLCNRVAETDKKIYVLIDEYDNFANTLMSYDENAYRNLTHGDGFFRLFFNSLKAATTGANDVIDRLYISGVSPMILSDGTSAFNVCASFSTFSDYYDMLGFTESEVRTMLEYYREATGLFNHTVEELIEIIKLWYGNNCFAEHSFKHERIFNPDMVLYFLDQYLSKSGTIPDQMIVPQIHNEYDEIRRNMHFDYKFDKKADTMRKVLNNGYIDTLLHSALSINQLRLPENLTSSLYYNGLLTHGYTPNDDAALVVPNIFARTILNEWVQL